MPRRAIVVRDFDRCGYLVVRLCRRAFIGAVLTCAHLTGRGVGEMNFHHVKDAWPALFPDLRFTFAIGNSSHPLFINCRSFAAHSLLIPPAPKGWQREWRMAAWLKLACSGNWTQNLSHRMRGGDSNHWATESILRLHTKSQTNKQRKEEVAVNDDSWWN